MYDGHGGSKAAEFVAENLHLNICEMLENLSEGKDKGEALREGYLKTDEEFLKQVTCWLNLSGLCSLNFSWVILYSIKLSRNCSFLELGLFLYVLMLDV